MIDSIVSSKLTVCIYLEIPTWDARTGRCACRQAFTAQPNRSKNKTPQRTRRCCAVKLSILPLQFNQTIQTILSPSPSAGRRPALGGESHFTPDLSQET